MLTFTPVTVNLLRNTDCRILITGASGWLGCALLEMLSGVFGSLVDERVILCGSESRSLTTGEGRILPIYSLSDGVALLDDRPTLVFHFAFLTKDQVGNMSEQEYIDRNRAISDMVARAIASRRVVGVMLASSGAVYDYLSSSYRDGAANLYGRLKAEDEQRFADICSAVSARFIAPRIFNISGPHINKFDAYALSAIIVDALRGGPVVLRANKYVYRSYFHVGDLLELTMRCLLDDGYDLTIPIFDTAGAEVVEVGELARKVCEMLDCPDVQIIRPAMSSIPDDRYVGDSSKLRAMLDYYDIDPLPLGGQISSTAAFIAQSQGVA